MSKKSLPTIFSIVIVKSKFYAIVLTINLFKWEANGINQHFTLSNNITRLKRKKHFFMAKKVFVQEKFTVKIGTELE